MGNYPEESIQHSEHGKSLKSRMRNLASCLKYQFNFPKVNSKIVHTNSSQISLHYSDIIFQIHPSPLVKHSHRSFNSLPPLSECDFIYEWLLMKTKRTFIYTYLLTYSMEQSPSWGANWSAASQEIPRISRNPKVHYRTHKRPPPVSILGQPKPVPIPTSHFLEIHLLPLLYTAR